MDLLLGLLLLIWFIPADFLVSFFSPFVFFRMLRRRFQQRTALLSFLSECNRELTNWVLYSDSDFLYLRWYSDHFASKLNAIIPDAWLYRFLFALRAFGGIWLFGLIFLGADWIDHNRLVATGGASNFFIGIAYAKIAFVCLLPLLLAFWGLNDPIHRRRLYILLWVLAWVALTCNQFMLLEILQTFFINSTPFYKHGCFYSPEIRGPNFTVKLFWTDGQLLAGINSCVDELINKYPVEVRDILRRSLRRIDLEQARALFNAHTRYYSGAHYGSSLKAELSERIADLYAATLPDVAPKGGSKTIFSRIIACFCG